MFIEASQEVGLQLPGLEPLKAAAMACCGLARNVHRTSTSRSQSNFPVPECHLLKSDGRCSGLQLPTGFLSGLQVNEIVGVSNLNLTSTTGPDVVAHCCDNWHFALSTYSSYRFRPSLSSAPSWGLMPTSLRHICPNVSPCHWHADLCRGKRM